MLTLDNFFKKLARNELKNLSMAVSGNIRVADQLALLDYTNEGLLRLYSRFILKENDILVELHDHITFYHLLPKFAVSYVPVGSTDNEPIRYLFDLDKEPFDGTLLKVLQIYDSLGQAIPLNDDEKHNSCFTPQAKMLQVPQPITGRFLSVRYQQRHTELAGNLEEEILCPDVLIGALTSYVAYKAFSHMNSPDSNAKAQEYNATYETVCNEAVDRDLVSSSTSQSNTRFSRGGWV